MQPKGTSGERGEFADLTFRREYRHRVEDVWNAIATPDGLRAWLMATEVVIDGRAGGRMEMVSGPARFHSTGRILVWQPPRVFEYEWQVAPVAEMPSGERAVVRYELQREGEVTRLVVTYRGLTVRTSKGFLPGLHALLDRLEAQLDGRPQPAFVTRFDEVRREYPAWSYEDA
jgi:uncharacterized protein YndB with AHSA1/START domain